MNRRWLATVVLGCVMAIASACSHSNSGPTASKEVHLDYAYYNPLSLVVRDQQLLEKKGYQVNWVLSAGSNKANEGLRSNALDLGSTAGAAALVARANGTPIKIVDVYSKPEWTALERGDVDAWSGLDPFLAQTVLEQGSRILYRNPDFNSFGVLNAREDVIANKPETVQAVVDAYEQARAWAKSHPDDLAALLAREAKVSPEVAKDELARTDLQIDPVPGAAQIAVLTKILPLAVSDNDIKSQQDGQKALETIIEPKFAQQRAQ
jgi:sulfonate transport system substrate-binding protein